jgi:uncharacterized damage-inducible protein DinB
MLFWHDLILRTIYDVDVDWRAAQGKDWPTAGTLDAKGWSKLLSKFKQSLEEAKEKLATEDLASPIPSFKDKPIAQLLLILAQHNSYHIGQIVVARQLLGIWPPPKPS